MYSNCKNVANTPCRYDPIVLPVRERVCNRYHTVEQPIICPVNTRIVHHYNPRPVYYPSYTVTEENQCCGMAMAANPVLTNPFGTTTGNPAGPTTTFR